ncbi:MAG: hypothetical protein JJU23_10755, partial [Cyclobacteriaceae bacterium]|nr:hypothetical protein [Cyclobacteriaceae bacterium]
MLNLQCLQRGVKILFFTFLLIITNYSVFAQKQKTINLPDYDEAWLHYGFIIAGHTSTYRLNYNDAFVGDIENTAINPTNNVGFTLGFLLNLRVSQFLDLRVTPQVSFYENNLDFIFRSAQDNRREVVERTTVEV